METRAPYDFSNVGIVIAEWICEGLDRPAETAFQVVTRSRNFELARFWIRDIRE